MPDKQSARSCFLAGMRAVFPMVVGSIPFGIIFGALGITAGLSWWATMGLSLIVFAGSAQFVAAGLVAQGAGVGIIVLTTFVVNLRHLLYSASLGPHVRRFSQRWIVPLAFTLTDETFAAVIQRYQQQAPGSAEHDAFAKRWFHMGAAVFMYVNWQLCTIVGIVAGSELKAVAGLGLEFAMVVTFIGIVVPLLNTAPMLVCALVAGAASLAFHSLPHQAGLMVGALLGMLSGLACQYINRWVRQ